MFCGNGEVDAGEECDEGLQNSNAPNAACRINCSLASCGDGILDFTQELCDDGNNLPGDGCDRFCKPEASAAPVAPIQVAGAIQFPVQQTTPTQVAGQFTELMSQVLPQQYIPFQYTDEQGVTQTIQIPMNQLTGQLNPYQQQGFPLLPNLQPLPGQLRYIGTPSGPPVGDTGPAALIIIIGGAAGGWAMSRKKKR